MIKEVDQIDIDNYCFNYKTPYRKFYVFEENNNIIGYFVLDIIYERIEIVDIFVNEDKRNRKIGTNMIKYIIDLARNIKASNITLEVKVTNKYAIRLYENFGFVKVATREKYYNEIDAMLMELIL